MTAPIVTREQCGLRTPRSVSHDITPIGVTDHYNGDAIPGFPWDHSRCPSIWRADQAYHMDHNGWVDIAYSAGVCPHGYIFMGRWWGVRTAANGTNEGNQKSHAVCYMAGAGQPFTDEAKLAFLDAHDLARAAGGGTSVWPHKFWFNTACLPLDSTDVLTPNGWLPLGEVVPTTELASYNVDLKTISFDRPLAITTPYYADTMTMRGVEMTANHRVYARSGHGGVLKARSVEDMAIGASQWVVPTSGYLENPAGLPITEDLVRFLVWVQADGSYAMNKTGTQVESIHFHFRKDRKIQRVREILDRLGKEYTYSLRKDGSTHIRIYGQEWIRQNALLWMPEKMYTWEWLQLSPTQFEALDEEILLADGCVRNGLYSSTQQQNLDVILALYHLNGRYARECKSNGGIGLGVSKKAQQFDYMRVDSRKDFGIGRSGVLVGCVTTHNDTILVRQNGLVLVVGNCPGAVGDWINAGLPRPGNVVPPAGPIPAQAHLSAPAAAMASSASGAGYYLVSEDGGVFTFGDALFHGSLPGIGVKPNQPIVGMAVTPSGGGYWLVSADGGVYAFGDAGFHGSAGGVHLNSPIDAIVRTPSAAGYWLGAKDGGVFAYGDAPFLGSAA